MSKNTKGAFGRPRSSPDSGLPYDLKADIAKVVRSVELYIPEAGGLCAFRVVTGLYVFHHLGLPAESVIGGMVYRAGEDPERDVIAFCGAYNYGYVTDDDRFLGHYWIKSGLELVDFSVGDWRQDTEDLAEEERASAARQGLRQFGPIQWTAPELPEFWWDKWALFNPPKNNGYTPPIGKAWYTGLRADEAAKARLEAGLEQMISTVEIVTSSIRKACQSLNLKDRLLALEGRQ